MRWLMGGQVYDVSTGSFRTADIGIAHGRIATVGSGARREHADDTIDALAKKYMDVDSHPFRQPGEQRITFNLTPERVSYRG